MNHAPETESAARLMVVTSRGDVPMDDARRLAEAQAVARAARAGSGHIAAAMAMIQAPRIPRRPCPPPPITLAGYARRKPLLARLWAWLTGPRAF